MSPRPLRATAVLRSGMFFGDEAIIHNKNVSTVSRARRVDIFFVIVIELGNEFPIHFLLMIWLRMVERTHQNCAIQGGMG